MITNEQATLGINGNAVCIGKTGLYGWTTIPLKASPTITGKGVDDAIRCDFADAPAVGNVEVALAING
ncbi:hypothetical protein LX87_01012 [Larkinella arboricola]|uniref:Uncharacterized protein n=1 Tax=Larkinella arboricola TaxID=643671 RepID=A0A327X835_LARAB|nr:hypothetical protein LX87_01012 [Larkinella arboricola]